MSSLLKNPSHVANIGYNGFNMEQTVDFTAAPCMLLPIYYDVLNPGDKFKGLGRVKLRTQPLEAASEFKSTVRLDWFAVPMEQVFKFFGSMYYNINDINTDLISTFTHGTNFPYIPVNTITSTFFTNYPTLQQGAPTVYEYVSRWYPSSSTGKDLSFWNGYMRLADCLGIPISSVTQSTFSIGSNSVFPYLFAAYQKIYFDFYRLSDREANDPSYYNLDSRYNTPLIGGSQFTKLCTLQYVPWNKDFTTNTFVSPLQGAQDIGSLGIQVQMFNNWLSGGNNTFTTGSPGVSSNFPNGGSVSISSNEPTTIRLNSNSASTPSHASTQLGINAANIRGMFALEKALEITRRSGKHYDAQTLAHWGVKVPDSLAGEVIYLGSQTQPFIVGDVISTSETSNEPLGTIAGKGYSDYRLNDSNINNVEFEAKTHTVLMCLFSVNPEVSYAQEGLDKLNALVSTYDWVHPETDQLGMQPYFVYQNNFVDFSSMSSTLPSPNDVFGWQYAYSELKLKRNRVFGNVSAYGTLSAWVPQVVYNPVMANNYLGVKYNSKMDFFIGSPSWLNPALTYPYMVEHCVNNVSNTVTLDYSKLYSRDPFIVHAEFSAVKSSKMSKYSLVNL